MLFREKYHKAAITNRHIQKDKKISFLHLLDFNQESTTGYPSKRKCHYATIFSSHGGFVRQTAVNMIVTFLTETI